MIFSDLSRPITESGSDGSKRRQAYNKLMHDLNQELSGTSVKSKLTPINKKIEDLETKTMTTDKEDWFNNPKDHSRLAVFTVSGVKDDNEDTNADDLYNAFDKLDYEGFYFFLKTDDDDNVTLIGLYDGSDDLNESAVESFKEFTAIDEANMQQLNLYLTQGDMYPAFAQSYYNQVAAASYALAPFVPSFNLPEYINLKAIQRYGVMTADIYLRRIGSLRYNNGKHPFKEFTMINVQSQNFIKIINKLLNNTKSIDKRYLKMYQYNFQNNHYRFSMVFAALIKEKKPKVLSLWYIDEKCELETIRIGGHDLVESVESLQEAEVDMEDYMLNGDRYIAWAQTQYNHLAVSDPKMIMYVPAFDVPEKLKIKTLEDIVDRYCKFNFLKGHGMPDFTLAYFQIIDFNDAYKYAIDKAYHHIKPRERFSYGLYQYNFRRQNRKYSIIILATNVKVYGVWALNSSRALVEIPLSGIKLLESDIEDSEVITETKRSELPDSAFGIPEDRKFPLDTEQHVRSAIKLFGHAEESKKKELAKRIAAAAKKYDIEIPETTQVYKYLHESAIDEFSVVEQLYHVSKDANQKILKPSIPLNFLTKNGYEDNTTKRVCFSTSIEGCLTALSANIKDQDFYVYTPSKAYKTFKPSKSQVPDVDITDEVWIKEPVEIECIGKIHVSHSTGEGLSYTYGNQTAVLYSWAYEWVDKFYESAEELEYLNETKRSNLPDSAFGIPEDRKFPLDTEQHVKSAIRLFGHAESSKKKSLAKKISRAASKYGIKIPETTQVYKYAHESAIDEGLLLDDKDIYYNKDKFDSGEINLCFITGLSGSGKSTMASGMKGVQSVELDDVYDNIMKFKTIEDMKQCGDAVYSYFKGPGKKYFTKEYNNGEAYDNTLINDFIKYMIAYAKSHPNDKFVVNGVWLFWFVDPAKLKDYAVYIKGTSGVKSNYRASKRDNGSKIDAAKFAAKNMSTAKDNQKKLNKYINYYSKLVNESTEDLDLPDEEDNNLVDLKTLLDNTDPKKVYLTSDWHFFKNHYKREENYVNTQKILAWCKQNIKDDDIFFYMGDICYKYANTADKKESQKLMASIPGIKVLLLGNHDIMLGEDYYSACGFKYVIETLEWDKYVFTHKPIDMTPYNEDIWNIHAHIHTDRTYNTSDGSRNVNIYPYFNDNKPYTLDYVMKHKEQMAKENHRSEWVNMGEAYNFKTNSIKSLEAIYESMRKDDIASTVFYSPDITSNSIAYMLSPFQDRLKGHIGVTIDVNGCYDNTNISPRLMSATMKSTRGNFIYSSEVHENDSCHNVINAAGYTNVAEVDQLDSTGELTISVPNMNKISRAESGMMIHKGVHLSTIDIGERSNRYDSIIVVTHIKNDHNGYYGAIENVARSFTSKNGSDKIYLNDGDPFTLMERITEATSAIQDYYEDNIIYINILQNMNAGRMPNIGILVSDDIVAVEQATIDFIRNCKNNKEFMENIGKHGSYHQIEYAEWLNMGTSKYKLYDVNNNRLKLEATYFDETKRSELPDSAFGIPEDRKFPLDTEQHVRSAIRLFGHAEESKKKELAKRIKAAASQYGIDIPETTQVYKYLHEAADTILPADVKNIVFDLGGVLIDDRSLEAIKEDPAFPKEYQEELYDLVVHKMFDTKTHKYLHTCDVDEAADYIISNVPKHLKVYIKPLMNCLSKALYKFDYTDELIDMLKENGYKVYYLSNWAYYSYKMSENFFAPFLDKFDGGLFSHEVDIEKPDLAIYNAFCQIFNVTPAECAFFDDREENVEAARKAGWNAYEFDPESTPMELMGTYDIVFEDLNDLFMAETDYGVKNISIDDIKRWYVSDIKLDKGMNEDMYATRLEDAIAHGKRNGVDTYYVYTCNYTTGMVDVYKIIPLGKIKVNEDNTYEWLIQYPVMLRNGRLTSCLEWAMASMNPVIGIKKPFVLKMGSDCGGTIDSTQYAFSPDIISDKFLVVNEEAHLEIVDSSFFDDRFVEEYEYVGNSYNIRKIAEAYNHQYIVDDSIFYTALSGKNMLSEDQIDFDKSFRKIDFELMKEKQFSEAATLRDSIMKAMGYRTPNIPIEEQFVMKNVPFMHKYNKNNDFSIREDYEGYYFYNSLNGKRSGSVATSDMLSEAMLRSIL